MKAVSVIALIVLVALLFVFIAPAVNLAPAPRLVRTVSLLIALIVLLPLAFPLRDFILRHRRRAGRRIRLKESLPAIPILDLDCVLLC
jgi:hypothetical protein